MIQVETEPGILAHASADIIVAKPLSETPANQLTQEEVGEVQQPAAEEISASTPDSRSKSRRLDLRSHRWPGPGNELERSSGKTG